jgi:signal transduction histidine kinase
MLDKLISNAVDFSFSDKEVLIILIDRVGEIEIQVVNFGPRLPEGMLDELFNSMVSVRNERTEVGPHLGLGLFVAKLIAEFHDGKIFASNLNDEEGVCISIVF